MITYRVPVVTNIQLFKYVEVEAVDETNAVVEVQRRLDLASEVPYPGEDLDDPLLAGLTRVSVENTIDSLRGRYTKESELQWVPGIVDDFEPVTIDELNNVLEVSFVGRAAHNRGCLTSFKPAEK